MIRKNLLYMIACMLLFSACMHETTVEPLDVSPMTDISDTAYAEQPLDDTLDSHPPIAVDTSEWESIQAASWQEAYRAIIQSDRQKLLKDPDNTRYLMGELVYIGIHDFDADGIPELIFGDSVSLAVFAYSNGCVSKIQDLWFPGTIWGVNGVHFQGNALRAECNGSSGSAYVNFGYIDGKYQMGRYTELSPDIPCTVNETASTLEEFERIYPVKETKYADSEAGIVKPKLKLIHDGYVWIIYQQTGNDIVVDDAFDFSQFIW